MEEKSYAVRPAWDREGQEVREVLEERGLDHVREIPGRAWQGKGTAEDKTKAEPAEVRECRQLCNGGQLGFPRFMCYAHSRMMWYEEEGPLGTC